ncbi:hypothetical protein [Niabella ginsenosidivorans]|uniref:hypothetical protein n=1 Tax=Niabella ginsenosidivorans TaxID=1176587 RepID=UPI0009FFC219|nr:hypothetical protein [Niabella ginsenosidivorans]
MEEVYDESLHIEHWAKSDVPVPDEVPFEEDELITSFALDKGEPIIKESTGYMGNYGPDLMHWYHYGAVMIWSPDVNARLLLTQSATSQLNWISYFTPTKQISDAEATMMEFMLSTGLNSNHRTEKEANYNAIADWLINRNDKDLLLQLNTTLLQSYFVKIDAAKWVIVLSSLSPGITTQFFEKLTETITLPLLEQLVALLREMTADKRLHNIAATQIDKLPHYFESVYHQTADRVNSQTLGYLFWFTKNAAPAAKWMQEMAAILTKDLRRSYVHKILVPLVLSVKDSSELANRLRQSSRDYLQQRADQQPQPLPNWSRPLPVGAHNSGVWQILKAFLESPTEQVFDYRKNQSERAALEDAIDRVTIDLKTETIKKGSPHTLRITKTQAAYQRQMKYWKEDVALLEKLNK